MGQRFEFTKLAECNVDDLFEDDSAELNFCQAEAIFEHREACEYIFYLGDADSVDGLCQRMADADLRPEFIQLVRDAAAAGANKILFWAD